MKSKVIKLKDGRNLGFIEYGDPMGKPMFFFHGWPGSRFSGKETDAAAKSLGLRVISTDRPGMGLSEFKKNRKLLDWPDDVVELANALNIRKFSVMGVSGGAPYVAACCYKIPNRVTKACIVVGLAPVDVPGNLDGLKFTGRWSWSNYDKWIVRVFGTIVISIYFKYFPKLGFKLAFSAKEDKVLLLKIRKKFGKENGTYEAFSKGIKGPSEELRIYTENWGFDLRKIKTRLYLWYAAKDKQVSLNQGKYYHSQIANSRLVIKNDWTHLTRYNYEKEILSCLI